MTLAGMIALDRNALICDLAETYQVYDYRSLPVQLVATLCSGLREDSRIRMKQRGEKIRLTDRLLVCLYDAYQNFLWARYGEGEPPESIYDCLVERTQKKENPSGVRSFDSPEAYEEVRKRIIGDK